MRREIEMPRLSETVDECLVTWLVAPGATVRAAT
jgi:pyruvate/2-oxoglutarate dehydrogenase complex dihydrolipoamide acyltransferase (E2) component